MNNPNSLLSPPSRPPPNKKVRGGATPRSIVGGRPSPTTTVSSGPPPIQAGGPPPTMKASSATSGGAVSAGSARRQAEMRRLADLRAKSGMPARTSQSQQSQQPLSNLPSAIPSANAAAGASGPPPMRPAGQQRHHSDIFPSVLNKQPSPVVPPKPLIDESTDVTDGIPPPSTKIPPPTPPIQRKLEYSNSGGPTTGGTGGPPPTASSPPSMVASTARAKASAAAQAKRDARSFVKAPTGAPRSKSAPPRRPPPGPPPPARTAAPPTPKTNRSTTPAKKAPPSKLPFSRTAERIRLAQENKDPPGSPQRNKSPHLIPSSKTVAAPVPAIESTQSPPPTTSAASFMSPPQASSSDADEDNVSRRKVYPKTPIPPKGMMTSTTTAGDETPPSTGNSGKREKMRLMREGAAAAAEEENGSKAEPPSGSGPPTTSTTTTAANATSTGDASAAASAGPNDVFAAAVAKQRLEQAYEDATADKDEALKQVKDLEERLRKSESELASMKLQQEQVGRDSTTGGAPLSPPRGFLSGLATSLGTPMRHTKMSERISAPRLPNADQAVQMEKHLIQHFQEAVQFVPFEYESDLAKFSIRRPYGFDNVPRLFGMVSPMSPEDYARRAHVSESKAIEVAATIYGDNSLFLLFDQAGVRFKTNPFATEWTTIENVDDDQNMSNPLPVVTYVDDQASDQQYSLEVILEEALKCREQYCKTVTATAIGFMNRPPAPAEPMEQPGLQKAPSKDVATETEEQGPVSTVQVSTNTDAGKDAPKEGKDPSAAKSESKPSDVDESSGSADVLTVFIGMIMSSVFNLIYFILIGLPLRILRTMIVFSAAFVILSALYMYTVQDTFGSRDMLLYTNNYPGIL